VTISTTTSGASIRYTTDGSTPTSTTGTLYSAPVAVGVTETLKAIAYKTGMTDSAVASAAYTINLPVVATPTFSPAAGITPRRRRDDQLDHYRGVDPVYHGRQHAHFDDGHSLQRAGGGERQ